ncbi:MAG: exodeoxyribonuclease VII small subunit [Bacteriovoracia bacterium]
MESEINLEEALKRLGEIVQKLEGADISLEDSLKLFEEGVQLSRKCHTKISDAEKKIEVLTKLNVDSSSPVETQPLT